MGSKDSPDSVVYPDGSQVHQPKGLVELQGYVFDARLRMAEVFEAMSDPARAAQQRVAAARLRERFEQAFWCEDIGFYAFGLDPIKSLASNVGHCLWTGLLRPDRAERVVRRFLEPDFSSGWGIRTLSALHPSYNPYSYHRGSVWPHDNALIAHGFKRYGYADECARVARDILEAASCFAGYRLPELYAGLTRQPGTFPVQYLGANTVSRSGTPSLVMVDVPMTRRGMGSRERLPVAPGYPGVARQRARKASVRPPNTSALAARHRAKRSGCRHYQVDAQLLA
jgi:glycogen debranching enzyme